MNEAVNDYKIKFGPYEVELKNSQVYFRKNNSLVKAIPVKSTFGLYDLKKMVKKIAASVNMTNKLPKDVLKANVNEAKSNFKTLLATSEDESVGRKIRLGGKRDPGQEIWQKVDRKFWMNLKTKKKLDLNKWAKHADEFHMSGKDLQFESKVNEAKDRELAKLFQRSIKASAKDGEDKLYKLSQDWEDWNIDNDDQYDDLVDPLFAAIELVQDAGVPGTNNVEDDKEYRMYIKSADKHLKTFNRDVKKAMKLHKESVNEKRDLLQGDLDEVVVLPGKSYKKLRYKVKDVNKFKGALVNLVKQTKIKVDLKNDGSGNFSLNGNFNPKDADKLDLVLQKTGAILTLAENKTEKKMNNDEKLLREMVRSIAKPLLESEIGKGGEEVTATGFDEETIKEAADYTYLDPRGNAGPIAPKVQISQYVKKKGGNKKGFFMIHKKNIKKAKKLFMKNGFRTQDEKFQDKMFDYMYENSISENTAQWTKTIKSLAKQDQLKKITKKDKETLMKIVRLMKTANESADDKLTELTRSDLQLMQAALKGIKAARVGNSAGATYLKSLKNSWRLDPKSKKDYMDFSTDDWEEDVINYIQNKG